MDRPGRPLLPTPSAISPIDSRRLSAALEGLNSTVEPLAVELLDCWKSGRQVFFAGNGGSAGNANHSVNDLIYPVSKVEGFGIR